jgi:hypothetical protein
MLALADAADIDVVTLAEVVHGQRRTDELKLIDGEHAPLEQIVLGQHGGGDRRLLQVGGASLGGDDDLLHRCPGVAAGRRG